METDAPISEPQVTQITGVTETVKRQENAI